ncbi:MAG TPA: mannose-1-phosphate guanylyltransferase/mannose-6-phosphate isomerase, partial [Usitatibacter sp.]|nr:mannose-1-phosphate guanylyltransferase/mannose-6-phosphate isomerase [Usitatibacter sp.]
MTLHPVILAGGSGTRLWPLSRESHPKQFLPLLGGKSPFQATLARLQSVGGVQPATIVASAEHRFLVSDQAREAGRSLRATFLEPCGRSTAPAVAVVAYDLLRQDPDATMLVLAADHDIPDEAQFAAAVAAGEAAAAQGDLVVFGVTPRWPETGYGYIERGDDLASALGCFRVAAFVEKPELEIATRLLETGRHYWNSGMFLMGARAYLEELERLEPELAAACRAVADACASGAERQIAKAAFEACKSISVDHAVFERTQKAAMVPAGFRWSDIGSWDALWDRAEKDGDGNECHGDVQLHDVENCVVRGDKRLVVGIGLEDTVIIDTPDAL